MSTLFARISIAGGPDQAKDYRLYLQSKKAVIRGSDGLQLWEGPLKDIPKTKLIEFAATPETAQFVLAKVESYERRVNAKG